MISIVCPFFNEADILEASVLLMIGHLSSLSEEWELIIVNDGSTDSSLEIAYGVARRHPRVQVVSYPINRGRGYAIRSGVSRAVGRIVVTTEIDSSWGDDIVHRIVAEFERRPDADIVIASPHLTGGGYRNVPMHRVFFSTVGNWIIRSGLTYRITMNTGMTRGYLRHRFLALPLIENGKEMHLEIVNKALALNYRIYEIPARLEWKAHKLVRPSGGQRKSSSRVPAIVQSHLAFSILAAPFRYIFCVSTLLLVVASFLFGWAFRNLLLGKDAIYLALTSFFVGLFGFLVFAVGVLAHQSRELQRELWRLQSAVQSRSPSGADAESDRTDV